MALLSLLDVSLGFGGPAVLENLNFQIDPGERVCLLGRIAAKLARAYSERRALRRWQGPRAILEKMMNQPDAQLVAAKFEDSTA
jgi:hypothetical protein